MALPPLPIHSQPIALPNGAVDARWYDYWRAIDVQARSTTVAADSAVPQSRVLTAGEGLTGGGALTEDRSFAITPTIVAGGPTGNSNTVPVITYNARGQLTAVTTATVTAASVGADATGTAAAAIVAHLAAGDPHPQYLTAAEGGAAYQPLDGDLTAIAALTTTTYGRGFLVYADEAAFKAGVNLEIGTDVVAQSHVGSGGAAHANAVASGAAGFLTGTDKAKLDGIEAAADVTDAANVGAAVHGASAKTTPVDADTMPLIDSAASNALKKVTWANVKATIQAYWEGISTVYFSGNLGLGAATVPTALLHLDKSGSGNYVRFTEAGDFRGLFGVSAGGGDLISGDADNDIVFRALNTLIFATNGLQSLVIDSSQGVTGAAALTWSPPASIAPANNGQLTFEATSDTSVTVKFKGADGVVRSVVLTLA